MNTKFNENMKAAPGFEHLFEFNNEEDASNHQAKIIMMKFLHEMEKSLGKQTLKKKELATILGVSPSYVTQLYNGDKLINLEMIARIEQAFGIEFKVQAVKKADSKAPKNINGQDWNKTNEERSADMSAIAAKPRKNTAVNPASMPDILNAVAKIRKARHAKEATKPQ